MKQQIAKVSTEARRIAVRRTALLVGAVAIAIYAVAILEVVFKK